MGHRAFLPAMKMSGGKVSEPAPVLCDLDGVIWLAHRPIDGSVEAVNRLRKAGHRVLFVTNNSFATLAQHLDKLRDIGLEAEGDVVSSAMACGSLLRPGSRTLVCGGPGLVEAARAAGAIVVEPEIADREPVDAVMVGFHRTFDYEAMRRASTAVRNGARFLASNDDATYPTAEGEIPGGGAILAAIETAAGQRSEVAGKPYPAMAALLRSLLVSSDPDVDVSTAVMVGDRPSTDGRFAQVLGCRFALVRSGVTHEGWTVLDHPEHFADCPVHVDVADLAAVADLLLGTVSSE